MENESTIGKISYINIQGGMIYNLGLSGNELLLYALIHGYTQDGKNEYHGSLTYIQNGLLLSRPTVISLLQKLQEKGLIVQTKESHYIASKESLLLVKKLYHTSKETLPVTSKETLPNIYNTINNNNNSSLSSNEDSSLVELKNQYNNDIVELNINNNTKILSTCSNKERNKIKKVDSTDEVFERLWNWYPGKKDAKQSARKYFDKFIKTEYDLLLLRYALPKYIESVKDKNYLVLLRTYLSEQRYLDLKIEFDLLNKKEIIKSNKEELKDDDIVITHKRIYEDNFDNINSSELRDDDIVIKYKRVYEN